MQPPWSPASMRPMNQRCLRAPSRISCASTPRHCRPTCAACPMGCRISGRNRSDRPLSQCQSRSRTADIPVGFLGHRVCGGLFRIGHALPHKNLRLQGYSFRLHPARATLTPYTATPRSTTDSAPSSFCTRSACPICLEGEATLAHLQRVRHSAPSPDVSFLRPYSLWAGDSSRDSYWKPSAKGACAHGPRGGMPPSHEGGIEHGRQS